MGGTREVAISAIAAVVLVGTLIFFHELGHFLFAKLFGVGVKVFSLGFGRRVAGFFYKGTDYRLSLLPLGGYVMMEGADVFQDGGDLDADPESETSFQNKPVWQRLIIVAAGPAFNLILPVAVFTGLYLGGEPQFSAVVGQVYARSPAAEAGLQAGDRILAIDGQAVTFWEEVERVLDDMPAGAPLPLKVQRGDATLDLSVAIPDDVFLAEQAVGGNDLGFTFVWPDAAIGIEDLNSPAGRAGLHSFDRVDAVDGAPIVTFPELLAALEKSGDDAEIAYSRIEDGAVVHGTLTLRADPSWVAPTAEYADPWANRFGLYPGSLFVHAIVEDSAAQEHGLQVGDRVLAVDDQVVGAFAEITTLVSKAQRGEGASADATDIQLTLVRDGSLIRTRFAPRVVRDTDALGRYRYRAMIGIASGGGSATPFTERRYYSLAEAVPAAVDDTWGLAGFIVEQVGKLVTLEADPTRSLGGPIQIFRDAAAAAEGGIFSWARMMGMLSVSLGIINFLPVPVLDGGQFLFYLVEGVRGRPMSLAVRERAQQIGVLFLVGLMFMVLIFDVNRWISS